MLEALIPISIQNMVNAVELGGQNLALCQVGRRRHPFHADRGRCHQIERHMDLNELSVRQALRAVIADHQHLARSKGAESGSGLGLR